MTHSLSLAMEKEDNNYTLFVFFCRAQINTLGLMGRKVARLKNEKKITIKLAVEYLTSRM